MIVIKVTEITIKTIFRYIRLPQKLNSEKSYFQVEKAANTDINTNVIIAPILAKIGAYLGSANTSTIHRMPIPWETINV